MQVKITGGTVKVTATKTELNKLERDIDVLSDLRAVDGPLKETAGKAIDELASVLSGLVPVKEECQQ